MGNFFDDIGDAFSDAFSFGEDLFKFTRDPFGFVAPSDLGVDFGFQNPGSSSSAPPDQGPAGENADLLAQIGLGLFNRGQPALENLFQRGESFLFGPESQEDFDARTETRRQEILDEMAEIEAGIAKTSQGATSKNKVARRMAIIGPLLEDQARLQGELDFLNSPQNTRRPAFDISQSALFSPTKATLEEQFRQAEDQLRANLPAGGALDEALTNLNAQRAQALTNLSGTIASSELDRIMTLATGGQVQGIGALTNATGLQSNLRGQDLNFQLAQDQVEQQGEADLLSGLLGLAGAAFGGIAGGAPGAAIGSSVGSSLGGGNVSGGTFPSLQSFNNQPISGFRFPSEQQNNLVFGF